MKFHTLNNHSENINDINEAGIYILELDQTIILFIKGFNYNSVLNYTPFLEKILNPSEEQIKKQVKLNEEQEKEKQDSHFYISLNDRQYVKGKIKFDLKFLKLVYLSNVNYVFLTNIEELILLVFLVYSGKLNINTCKIVATLPVKQIGYYIVDSFYQFIVKRNKYINLEELNKNYFQECEFYDYFEEKYHISISQWEEIFNEETFQKVMECITTVNHGEEIELYTTNQINGKILATPHTAGHNIGSSLWHFSYSNQNIVYANQISISQNRHPLGIQKNKLKHMEIDYLILGQPTSSNQNAYELQVQNFINLVNQNLFQNKNIVVPIKNSLFLLDLIDTLNLRLSDKNKHIFVFSSSIKGVVQFSNSMVEYLNDKLQSKIYMEKQQTPFSAYEQMIEKQKLQIFEDFSEFQLNSKSFSLTDLISQVTPAIFFVEDSTLRFGDSLKILEMLEATQNQISNRQPFNTSLILVDPQMQGPLVTNPILNQFKGVNIVHSEIDAQLRKSELSDFVNSVKPKNLIIDIREQDILNQGIRDYNIHYFQNDKDLSFKIAPKSNLVIDESEVGKIWKCDDSLREEEIQNISIKVEELESRVGIIKNDKKSHLPKIPEKAQTGMEEEEEQYLPVLYKQIINKMAELGYSLENQEQGQFENIKQNLYLVFQNSQEQILIRESEQNVVVYGESQEISQQIQKYIDQEIKQLVQLL